MSVAGSRSGALFCGDRVLLRDGLSWAVRLHVELRRAQAVHGTASSHYKGCKWLFICLGHIIHYLYFSRLALHTASTRLLIGHCEDFKWNQQVITA